MIRSETRKEIMLAALLLLAIAVGAAFGLHFYRRGLQDPSLKATSAIRVLSFTRLLDPALLKRFQAATGIRAVITEVKTPAELSEKLQTGDFDVTALISYQVPLAIQRDLLLRIDPTQFKHFADTSPDFRQAPGDDGLVSTIPVLWGIDGIAYRSSGAASHLDWDSLSWLQILNALHGKGKLGLPNSSFELERLAKLGNISKHPDDPAKTSELAKSLQLSDDFLSPASLLKTKDLPEAILIAHGEMAFPAMNGWQFVLPDDKSVLWILSFAIDKNAKSRKDSESFIDFLLTRESSIELVNTFHQASTNRAVESVDIDPKLKPSHLRFVPLTSIEVAK